MMKKVFVSLIVLIFFNNIITSMCEDFMCKSDEYQCFSNENIELNCVQISTVCDGKQDCPLNDDEINCNFFENNYKTEKIKFTTTYKTNTTVSTSLISNTGCYKDDIPCLNKERNITECLSLIEFCEAYPNNLNCDNHKTVDDEILKNLCSFYKLSKKPIPFDCGRSVFISKEMVCDGNSDCPNGFDEFYSLCSQIQCEFKCNNNQCTLNKYVCDGINQCTDGSDEINCPYLNNSTKECNEETEFECVTSSNVFERQCINIIEVCDSFRNCIDGSDEWPTLCSKKECNKLKNFRCEWNGACIDKHKVCDGNNDCVDFSDERNCTHGEKIEENFYCTFKCQNGTCLHNEQICDRVNDCENGEDEMMCNFTLCSRSLNLCGRDINSICKVKPFNYYNCECKNGFVFDEKLKICLDINECNLGRCSHSCANTHGGFVCNCNDGYIPKQGTCIKNISATEIYLLYSDQNRIFKFNMNNNYSELLFQSENPSMQTFKISDFNFSIKKKLLIFSEFYSHSIYIQSLITKSVKLLINTNDQILNIDPFVSKKIRKFRTLIAFDWIHENLYYNLNNSIYAIGPINFKQSQFVNVKIISHIFEIRSLIVSPLQKRIFWLDIAFGTIESASLDGSNRRILVKDLLHVQALTIDHVINRLYWLDTEHGHIATCDFNGNNYYISSDYVIDKPFSMTSFDKSLFYIFNGKIITISTDRNIQKTQINEKLINRLIQTDNSNIIQYYSDSSQPESVINQCNCNSSCLCLALGNIYKQDTKCYCQIIPTALSTTTLNNEQYLILNTTIASIIPTKSYILINSAFRIITILSIILCMVYVSVKFRIKPKKWFLNTSNKYICKFRRKEPTENRNIESIGSSNVCSASVNTVDSTVDVETEIILNEINDNSKKKGCFPRY